MGFKRITEVQPLSQEELRRVTEINFRATLEALSKTLGSPMILFDFISTIAFNMAVAPDSLVNLARESFAQKGLPPGKDELIEIYYRSGIARRSITDRVRCRDSRITQVMKRKTSAIEIPKMNQSEAYMAYKFVTFFTKIVDGVI